MESNYIVTSFIPYANRNQYENRLNKWRKVLDNLKIPYFAAVEDAIVNFAICKDQEEFTTLKLSLRKFIRNERMHFGIESENGELTYRDYNPEFHLRRLDVPEEIKLKLNH